MKQTVEEAAIESCVIDRSIYNDEYQPYYLDGFKDGAEWQANQSPWISVKERLPETGTIVITKGAYGFLICHLSDLGEWETGANVNEERLAITHWCHIPYFDNNYKSSKE